MSRFALRETGSIGRNLGFTVVAQGITLVSNIMMSVAVPKVLGIEDYAYWQLFTLYVSYIGLLLLGIHDGVFLRIGGIRVEGINWGRIKAEFLVVTLFQIAASASIALFIVAFRSFDARSLVLLLVVADGLIVNPASFLYYVLRAANMPDIYSRGTAVSGGLWAVALIIATLIHPEGFLVYALLYLVTRAVMTIYCYLHFREVFQCKRSPLSVALADIRKDCVAGMKVTIAYYASTLVVGSCRMLVDARWGLAAFGKFSLSVSLVNFLLAFMAQISMVVFPVVRRMSGDAQEKTYALLRGALILVLPTIYLLYYPVCSFLEWWLPQYADSLKYLSIILPICFFDCKMQLLVNTYLKLMRKEGALLWINVATLAGSVILMLAVAAFSDNVDLVAVSMVVAIAVRSVVAELYLGRFIKVGSLSVMGEECLLAAWFVISSYVLSSFLLTLIGVMVFYVLNCSNVRIVVRGVMRRR